jgi:hypothetical protein
MEFVALNGQVGEFLVRHPDACLVGILVQLAPNLEPRVGGRAADPIDDDLATDQGAATPVVGDVAEHTVPHPVPFAGARRKMADLDGQVQLVGELLQFKAPQANLISVVAAAVCRD